MLSKPQAPRESRLNIAGEGTEGWQELAQLHARLSPQPFPKGSRCAHVPCPCDPGKDRNTPQPWLHSAWFFHLRVIPRRPNQVAGLIRVVCACECKLPEGQTSCLFFPRLSHQNLTKCHTVGAREIVFKRLSECYSAEAAVMKWQVHGIGNCTGWRPTPTTLSGRDSRVCHSERKAHLVEPQFLPL